MAAGKSGNSLPDIGQLTQDELQFLGIYLSNFYVPFSTELGIGVESEEFKAQRETMIQALKSNLNFNETVCGELVDNIIGLSRSNCYELRYGFVKEEDEIPSDTKSCSYWDFVNLMFGGFNTKSSMVAVGMGYRSFRSNAVNALFFKYNGTQDWFNYYDVDGDVHNASSTNVISGNVFGVDNKNYVKFGYKIGDEFYEVCSAYQNGSSNSVNFTPSQIAFFQCLLSVNTNMGYGLSFLDLFDGDIIGASGENVLDYLKGVVNQTNSNMSASDIYALSAYSNRVYVDCFGNLIRYGGSHQTIIMPGCMNPYTWVGVQSNGEDNVELLEKRFVVLPCIQNLSCLNMHDLLYSDSISSSSENGMLFAKFSSPMKLSGRFKSERAADVKIKIYGGVVDKHRLFTKEDDNKYRCVYDYDENGENMLSGYKWNLYTGDSTKDFDSITTGDWIWNGQGSSGSMLKLISDNYASEVDTRWLKFDEKAYTRSGDKCLSSEKVILGGKFSLLEDMGAVNYSNSTDGHYLATNMCFIDDLGAFGFESSNSDIAYDTIQIKSILNNDGSTSSELAGISSISSSSSLPFSSVLDSVKRGQINVVNVADSRLMVSLYTTYAIAGLYDDSSKAETIGKLGYRINREGLPKISNSPLLISQSTADEQIKKDLLNMLYYLLKPDAVDYIRIAIKNKLQAILVGWHNDMVGTSGTGATLGTTYYRTNYGYVTTPDLSEIQWTSSLMQSGYNSPRLAA